MRRCAFDGLIGEALYLLGFGGFLLLISRPFIGGMLVTSRIPWTELVLNFAI